MPAMAPVVSAPDEFELEVSAALGSLGCPAVADDDGSGELKSEEVTLKHGTWVVSLAASINVISAHAKNDWLRPPSSLSMFDQYSS